jgi:hypothetical protein
MITAVVTLLGGWRATAFAVLAALALSGAGYERLRVHALDRTIADLTTAAAAQRAEYLTQLASAAEAARATEQRQADAIAAADIHYQREKADAIDVEKRVADGLRAGTLSLRHKLAACSATSAVSASPGDTSGTDDGAELRAAVAQSVAIGAGCDARVRALQAVVTADRR